MNVRVPEEMLSVAEIVAITKLSRSAVYRAIEDGELQATKLRGQLRVTRAAFDAWLEANTVRRERREPVSFERGATAARPSGTFAAKLAERKKAA